VDVAWMGTITDPVCGSGFCPAWMARVENPVTLPAYGELLPL
jgi:hypothetical protein